MDSIWNSRNAAHRGASSSQVTSSTAEIKSPDLNLILQRLEDIQHQDPLNLDPMR